MSSDGRVRQTSLPPPTMMDPRRLVLSTIAALGVLMIVVVAIGYLFRAPLLTVSKLFVDVLGGLGVAVGFFLPDAFTIPLPNDVVTLLGVAGGMGFVEVCAWAFGGSLAGGATGYWIGRYLRTTRFITRIFERRGSQVQATIDRYGVWAVAVAALTPIPYSIFCWAAGAGKLSFRRFMLVSQLRVIRVVGYLYLLQLGMFAAIGL